MTYIAVTIAGSDSGGGAGIQADLKTFSALGVYGASVVTALTAQNTQGVTAIHDPPAEFIREQINAVFSDLNVNATKIGMVSKPETIRVIATEIKNKNNVVLDPVMVAESGDQLIDDNAINTLIKELFGIVDLITPNLHESARLTNQKVATSKTEMEEQSKDILNLGANAVLIKGGHSDGNNAEDLFVDKSGFSEWFVSKKIETKNTHGTGCSLSSAITAEIAKGKSVRDAIKNAKKWITGAIQNADKLKIGQGSGPVNHFYEVWK